jgi:hypothetical protein
LSFDPTPRPGTPTSTDWRLTNIEQRLRDGADTFEAVRKSIESGRNKWTWFLVGLVVTVVSSAIGIGQLIAKLEQTVETQDKHETKLERIETDIAQSKSEQVRLRGSVDNIDVATQRLEQKLDRALAPSRRTR